MKKIISIVLVAAIMATFVVPASAFEKRITGGIEDVGGGNIILELQDELGLLQIVSNELPNGDIVLVQYLNGVVTDEILIDDSESDVAYTTYSNLTNDDLQPILMAGSAMLGTINYVALTGGTGTVHYGLKVHCSESYPVQSTYTINGWTGTVVSLIAILVSGLSVPTFVASAVVNSIIAAAGITVIGGAITAALSTTVAALKTTYSYTVIDKANSSHTNSATSYRYDVNDQQYYTGATYYDGYSPANWGTTAMGLWFHNMLFAYSNFSIESWQ
jgi:hypothetical protein